MNKSILLSLILLCMSWGLRAQTATPPALGDGTSGNPYQISTLANLYWIAANPGVWDKSFNQTADIDATPTSGWLSGAGWSPIGTNSSPFVGTYDGQGHKISNLYINRPGVRDQGLFGHTGNLTYSQNSRIQNLGVTQVNISGGECTGGLVGCSGLGDVLNCYSTGTVVGDSYDVGGLVGLNFSFSSITYCYSEASVTGPWFVGGLVGELIGTDSNIINSYSRGTVTSTSATETSRTGGLVGSATYRAMIRNCYSTGFVSGPGVGGLIGYTYADASVYSSYWDVTTSGVSGSAGGTRKTTAEMKNAWTYTGWDFYTIWAMNSGINDEYPFLPNGNACYNGTLSIYRGRPTQTVFTSVDILPIVYFVGGGASGAIMSPALPTGMSGNYDPETGTYTISGQSSSALVYNYTITTSGTSSPCTEATKTGTITIIPPPLCGGFAVNLIGSYDDPDSRPEAYLQYPQVAVGPPDELGAHLNFPGEYIALDLTGSDNQFRPSGSSVILVYNAINGGYTCEPLLNVQCSMNGTEWTEPSQYVFTSSNGYYEEKEIALNANTRYIKLTLTNCFTGSGIFIDAVTYDPATVPCTCIAPDPPLVANNGPICQGDVLSLTATTVSGASYSWSGPNGFSSTEQNPTVSAAATTGIAGTYSVTTTVGGCTSVPATTTVVVNALPLVGFTGNTSIFEGQTTTVSPATGGTWTSGNETVATINNEGRVNGISAGTATFTFTSATSACSATTEALTVKEITCVNGTIVLNTGSEAQTVCAGTPISSIVYRIGGGASGASVSPALPNGLSGTYDPGAKTYTISGTTTATGTHNYTVTTSGTGEPCAEATANGTITVNPSYTPSVTIQSDDTDNSICAGTSVIFSASASNTGGGSVSYTWKLNGSTVGTDQNNYLNSTLANGDRVICVINVTGGECLTSTGANSNEITLTVNPNLSPSVTITSSDADNMICDGTDVTFTATPQNTGGGTVAYQWNLYNKKSNTLFDYTTWNGQTWHSDELEDGDYVYCEITVTGGTCLTIPTATSNTITTSVCDPGTNPTVTIKADPSGQICSSATVTFTATPGNICAGTVSYAWKLNGHPVGMNQNNVSLIELVTGDVVDCQITVTNATCYASATASSNEIVIISTIVDAGKISGKNAIQVGESTSLSSSVPGGQWYCPDEAIAIIDASGVVTGTGTGTTTILYGVEGGPPCNEWGVAEFPITVGGCTPPTPTFTESPSSPQCPVIQVTYTTQAGKTNYVWNIQGDENADYIIISGGTSIDPTVTLMWLTDGSKTVTVNYTEDCEGLTPASSTIIVSPPPTATISYDGSPYCRTGTATVTLTGPEGGTFQRMSGLSINTSTGEINLASSAPGSYIASYSFTGENGCTGLATTLVEIKALPTVSITGASEINSGETTTLSPVSGGTWISSDEAVAIVTDAGVVTGAGTGTATFTFTAGTTGCSATTGPVTVKGCSDGTLTLTTDNQEQTACLDHAITEIAYSIGGGASGAEVTGLPDGVGWNSDNGEITISGTPTESGTFDFIVKTVGTPEPCNDAEASGTITVSAPPYAGTISGSPEMCVGATAQLKVDGDVGGTWASTNTEIAAIDAAGLVSGVSPGSVTISYTVNGIGACGNDVAEFQLEVNEPQNQCTGYALAVLAFIDPDNNMNPQNATGEPDDQFAAIGYMELVKLDLTGGSLTLGDHITINMRKGPGDWNPYVRIHQSQTGQSWSVARSFYVTSDDFTGYSVTLSENTRYISIENLSQYWLFVESVTYQYACPECTDGTLTLVSDNESQSICLSTAVTDVVYATGGSATGATVDGLPDGVTGSFDNGTFTISGTPTETGTFNYTVTTSGTAAPCNGATATGTITVNAIPDPPVVGTITQPDCAVPTGSVELSGLPSGDWTLTSSPGGIITEGNSPSATVGGLSPSTTFTFTVTNADGCTSLATGNIVINSLELPPAPVIGTITQPTCSVATGSVVLKGLPKSGTWTVTSTGSSGTVTKTGKGPNATLTGLTAGTTYIFTVTDRTGCTSLPSDPVDIIPQPEAPLAPAVGPHVFCGSATVADLPQGNDTETYQWYDKAKMGKALKGSAKLKNGTYYVSSSSGSCESERTPVTVLINPIPTVFFVRGGGISCAGGIGFTVQLSGSETGVNYQLNLDGSPVDDAIVPGTGSAIRFVEQTLAGIYTVIATNAATGCQAAMKGCAVIKVITPPVATGIVYSTNASDNCCHSGKATVILLEATPGGNFSSTPPGLSIDRSNGDINFERSHPGQYTVKYTVSNLCGTARTSTTITVTKCTGKAAEIINNETVVITPVTGMVKAYPNPFIDRVYFEFVTPEDTRVMLEMFDLTGRKVQTVFDNDVEGGEVYKTEFTTYDHGSGIYLYRLIMGNVIYNGKVICK